MKSSTIKLLAALACAASIGGVAHAATIIDNTPGTATKDGTIGGSEYVGGTAGINSGFGGVIGSGSTLYIDSDTAGNVNLGFSKGAGSLNDVAVMYIDSVSGGVSSTIPLNDTGSGGDALRAAISGDGTGGNFSDLTFASGFGADYAVAWNQTFAGLFQLNGAGSHTFIADLGINPSSGSNNKEMSFTLANIGLTANTQASFKYVVTYLNSSNAFRSDEFNGVASFTGGNPGNGVSASRTLAAGDFHTFQSIPEPSTVGLLLLSGTGMLALFRRRNA